MKVSFTEEQFKLVRHLLQEHYDEIASDWANNDTSIAYGAMVALRIPMAQKAWEEYCETYPDVEWRAYPTREEFFEDQFTIYPSDLVTV